MDRIKIHLGRGFEEMESQVEQMMDDMLHLRRAFVPRSGQCWGPPMDLYETQAQIIILMEMAGLKSDQIQVIMDRGMLKISGLRANPIQEPDRRVHQMELDFGPFERRVRVRVPVVLDGIEATYRDGFLVIRVPKAQPREREIPVEV
jgi:HSP20 family protein